MMHFPARPPLTLRRRKLKQKPKKPRFVLRARLSDASPRPTHLSCRATPQIMAPLCKPSCVRPRATPSSSIVYDAFVHQAAADAAKAKAVADAKVKARELGFLVPLDAPCCLAARRRKSLTMMAWRRSANCHAHVPEKFRVLLSVLHDAPFRRPPLTLRRQKPIPTP